MIESARGKINADLVLKNGTIIDVFTNELIKSDVAITNGVIVGIGNYSGNKEMDMTGKFLSPGFIDAHLHLESTMVTPDNLIYQASLMGTTTFIVDPHEAANVSGALGIDYILSHTNNCCSNVFVMMPSCVPATDFEDNGFEFTDIDMQKYKNNNRILGLGEVMDSESVLNYDSKMIKKLNLFSNQIIDGHATFLSNNDLCAYILSGITTNHEYFDYDDAIRGLRNGMNVLIREGSAAKNLEIIVKGIIENNVPTDHFAFCTDDKHIEEIIRDGHISTNIRKAITLGMDIISAYKIATINAARIYNLKGIGALSPGFQADIVVLNDLKSVDIDSVFYKGKLIDNKQTSTLQTNPALLETVNVKDSELLSFELKPRNNSLPVLEIVNNQIFTKLKWINEDELNGEYQKIAVVERHKATGKCGVGLVYNFGIKNGAIASSVAHDSHNIVIIGDNDTDMHIALSELIGTGGGYTIVKNHSVRKTLPLPIMGLISDKPYEEVNSILSEMIDIAYNEMNVNRLIEPFITLSFLALPVIPQVRVTARGIYDVTNKTFI